MSLTSRASFPGTARLRSPAEFAPALKGRRLARGALFVLSVAPPPAVQDAPSGDTDTQTAATPQARLGLVIGKRYAPLSVSRNAIKRVIREAFRHKRLALPAGDYVVRLHTRIPSVSLTALKHMTRLEMDGHWLRAARSGRNDARADARPDARTGAGLDLRGVSQLAGQPGPRVADNAVTPDKGAERDGTRV